jgi:type I restriction enzyme S subunit
MSEWKEYTLRDIINVKHGYAFKGEYFSEIPTNDILLSPGNFNIGGGFKSDKFKYYKGEYPASYILKEGDIIVTMTDLSKEGDTLGFSARIPKHKGIRYLHNQRLGLLQLNDEKFNKDFIYWLLRTREYQQFIVNSATGSTVKHTSPTRICDYNFSAPDYNTQTAIAEILSSLDDKIELNNQINKDLEALAQSLFKQWFVYFEFPNENGEPYRSSGGEMVDSEIGEIPKEWKVFYLNEIAKCFDNKRIPLSSLERNKRKGSFPYYGAASLMDYVDDFIFDGVYLLMGEDGSVTDNLGFPIIQYVFGKFWTNNHAHVLQGTYISTELLMCLMKNTNIEHLVTGAVQPKLNQGNMNKISIALPSDISIIKTIDLSLKSIFEQVRENISENFKLITLRDYLLPKLISGELEV